MTARNLAAGDDPAAGDDDGRGGLRPLPLGLAAGHSADADGSAGVGPGGRPAIGGLARGARGFATRIGLGFTARRAGLARIGLATDGLAVRPPVDFWPGGADEPHPLDRVRTGDPAYDRLVNQRRAAAAAGGGRGAGTAERVGRGLPASIHRRGRTIAGPRTAPGAGGMRPGEIRPAPNEATRLAPSSWSTMGVGAGPRAAAASGARPRLSSGPPSGGSRSTPTGGGDHPASGGRGRGGRSTTDDPGGADADLAAIVARRAQQTEAEAETGAGGTITSLPIGASAGGRSPVRRDPAGADQVYPGAADPRPPSRPVDPRARRVAPRAPGALNERHDPTAAGAGVVAGHGRTPRPPSGSQPVSEPSRSRPGLTPDPSSDVSRRAADAAVDAEADTAEPTTVGPVVAGGRSGLATPSAAEGLPVRFAGLVTIETDQPPGPSSAVAPPTSPPAPDRPMDGPATARPAPPDALPPADDRPGDAATGSVRAVGLPTGGEPIRRSAAAGPAELRSAAEGLPVRGTALPAASSDHQLAPSGPGSSVSPSAADQRSAGTATADLAIQTLPSGRPPAEHRTQTTAGDHPRPTKTSSHAPNEHPTQGDGGRAAVGEQVGGDPGGRFLAALASGRPDRSTGLPGRFRPLARALTGGAPVRLVTGAATRRALDVVGSAAATVGRTIYLAEAPGTGSRHREILAHELVHAARPSPVPRFFADPRPSAEERLAHDTGRRVAAGLPLAAASLGAGRFAAADSHNPSPTTGSPSIGLVLGAAPTIVRPGRRVGPTLAGTPRTAAPAPAVIRRGIAPASPGSPQAPAAMPPGAHHAEAAPASAGAYRAAALGAAAGHQGTGSAFVGSPQGRALTSSGVHRAVAPGSAGAPHGPPSAGAGTPLGLAPTLLGSYRTSPPVLVGALRAAAPLVGALRRSADHAAGGTPFAGRPATASAHLAVGDGLRRAAVPLGVAPAASERLGAGSAIAASGGAPASGARRSPLGGLLATGHAPTTAVASAAALVTGVQRSAPRVGPPRNGRPGAGGLSTGWGSGSAAGIGPDLGASISRHGGVLRRESSAFRGFRDTERAEGANSTPSGPPEPPGSPGPSLRAQGGGQPRTMGTAGLPVGGLSNVVGPPATSDAATARRQTVHREQARRPGVDPTTGALTTAGGGGGGAAPSQAGPQTAGGGTPPPTTGPTGDNGGGNSAGGPATTPAATPTASAFDDIDRLVELLEERLLAELERRGARFRGGPF